jgi:hypothetical protein
MVKKKKPKRTLHNQSGEPMEAAGCVVTRALFRRLHRRAERRGVLLGRFKQIYGWESQLGPEWVVYAKYYPELAIGVWQLAGDDVEEEAKRTCTEVLTSEWRGHRSIYGVSWRGPWDKHPEKSR